MKNNKKQHLHYPRLASFPRLVAHTCRQTQLGLKAGLPWGSGARSCPQNRTPFGRALPSPVAREHCDGPLGQSHLHTARPLSRKNPSLERTQASESFPRHSLFTTDRTLKWPKHLSRVKRQGEEVRLQDPWAFFWHTVFHIVSQKGKLHSGCFGPLKELEGWGARVVVENAAVLPPCGHTS